MGRTPLWAVAPHDPANVFAQPVAGKKKLRVPVLHYFVVVLPLRAEQFGLAMKQRVRGAQGTVGNRCRQSLLGDTTIRCNTHLQLLSLLAEILVVAPVERPGNLNLPGIVCS